MPRARSIDYFVHVPIAIVINYNVRVLKADASHILTRYEINMTYSNNSKFIINSPIMNTRYYINLARLWS